MERTTMRRIREAVKSGTLAQPFRASDVNRALGIDFSGVFLPKHRAGNPGGFTEQFVQIERGTYRLKQRKLTTEPEDLNLCKWPVSKSRENACQI